MPAKTTRPSSVHPLGAVLLFILFSAVILANLEIGCRPFPSVSCLVFIFWLKEEIAVHRIL